MNLNNLQGTVWVGVFIIISIALITFWKFLSKFRIIRSTDFLYICFMNIIETNMEQLHNLCKQHKVGKLFVFGSVLKATYRKNSDIDFIVDFENVDLYSYADNYFDLKYSLEKLFERDVDLLEDKAINNPYLRQSIDATKQLVYG